MTQASPDGTGTQTDEVSRALVVIRNANGLLDGVDVWEGELAKAASVLSAEIERLTRRVEELETVLRPFARMADLLENVAPDAGYSPDTDALIAQRPHEGTRGAVTVGDCRRAHAALASAAAPDERVLTEREQYTVGELLTCRTFDYPRVMTEAHAIIQRLVSARTPDQDTAP